MTPQLIDIGYRPHAYQMQIHMGMRRFTVCVCHRRFGKTYMSIGTLIHAALATQKQAARWGYLAPYLKQAKGVAWDYLKTFTRQIPGVKINEAELAIDFPNGSRIRLFGGDNADSMRGLYFDGVVIDELADLKPDVWGSVIRPALSDRKGWALFIGTPKGFNQFSELYQFALAGKEPDWAAMMYRVDETDLIDAGELRSAKAVMSDAQYRQEYLCDFSASADNALITIDQVSAAVQRKLTEKDIYGLPKILGVDVARFGDDRSVIIKRQGLQAFQPTIMTGIDNMTLAARVAGLIEEEKPDAVFIDAGRGEGVIDRLRQLGYSVIEVNFGSKPDDPAYVNKRSEIWDRMAKWLRDGGALPNDLELKNDLVAPTYEFDSANRMKLESKDAMKERGLRSSDVGDALALTFAYPVAARASSMGMRERRPMVVSDYDPFAGS